MASKITLKNYLSRHFSAVAVLPVMIIACLTWWFMMPAIKARTGRQHQAMAISIADQLCAHLAGGERGLAALAGYLGNRQLRPDPALNDLLDAHCGNGDFFEALFVVDNTGFFIQAAGLARARRQRRSDFIGMDLSGRRPVYTVKGTQTPAWSKSFLSTVDSRPAVALTIPLAQGFIIGELTLENLSKFISHPPAESQLLTLIMDDRGTVVTDSQRRYWGQIFPAGIVRGTKPEDNPMAVSKIFELNGLKMLGTAVEVEETGWKVLMAQPLHKALKPLWDTLILIGLGLVLALVLALSIGWFLSGKFSHVFTSYAKQAASVANGCYDLQWPDHKTAEFALLRQSLERMAQKIAKRERELKANEHRTREILVNIPGVVFQHMADPNASEARAITTLARERGMEIFGLDFEHEHFIDHFVACLPEKDRSRFVLSVEDAVEAVKPWHYEGRFNKPSGEEIWFEGRSSPRRSHDMVFHYGMLTDITERKALESSLRMARSIIDNAPMGIWRMGADGRIIDVNKEGCISLGYTQEELYRMTVFDLGPAMDRGRWAKGIDTLKKAGSRTVESLHRRRNGEVFPIQVVEKMVRFEAQEFHIAFIENIFERKQADKALQENRQLLSNILESMDEAVSVIDHEFAYQLVNKKNEEMSGKSRQEVMGRAPWDVFPHIRGTVFETHVRNAMKGGVISGVESRIIDPDGGETWMKGSFSPLKDSGGSVMGVVAVGVDITRQKQDEQELIRLRNYLSNVIDAMPSVLVGVDSDGAVTQWNHRAGQLTGISSEKACAKPLDQVFPGLKNEIGLIKASIRDRRVLRKSKVARRNREETRYEDITIFPLEANGVKGAVIRVDDVTEQMRMEEMMIQSEKMLSVGGLAAGMAHEINNPLAGMMQTAQVMAQRLTAGAGIPANHKAAQTAGTTMESIEQFMADRGINRMVDAIIVSGQRVAQIVNNMLSFARRDDMAKSTHHLNQILDRTIELAATDYNLKKKFDFRQIEITREYDENLPVVPCQASKIQQVILNILTNGTQAMQGAETLNARFIIRTYADPARDMVCMEIEDNGPGMAEKIRKQVFDPFFTTKPVGVGTGLGLSVSYFIITQNHGGTMDVMSEPGKGSVFTIRLPLGQDNTGHIYERSIENTRY